jgi:hypothetical protein
MIRPAHEPPISPCPPWSQEIKSMVDLTRDFSAAC